jgi:hypothetical protein
MKTEIYILTGNGKILPRLSHDKRAMATERLSRSWISQLLRTPWFILMNSIRTFGDNVNLFVVHYRINKTLMRNPASCTNISVNEILATNRLTNRFLYPKPHQVNRQKSKAEKQVGQCWYCSTATEWTQMISECSRNHSPLALVKFQCEYKGRLLNRRIMTDWITFSPNGI